MDTNCGFSVRGNRCRVAAGVARGQSETMERPVQVALPAGHSTAGGNLFFDFVGDFGVVPVGCDQGDAEIFQCW